MKGTKDNIDWVSVCTPNYTHDAFIRYGLRMGADVICEKPVVLNPWNLEALMEEEKATGHKAYNILQLRLHDSIAALKKKVEAGPKDKIYDIDLTYITSRGKWYYSSWKGDNHKSGGVATNIGVHFYDMLQWIFGPVQENIVHVMSFDHVAGYLGLKNARVRYFLSINAACLPENAVQGEKKKYRTLNIDGDEFEFSAGFTELHTKSYQNILAGEGFRISEALPCIQIVHDIYAKTLIKEGASLGANCTVVCGHTVGRSALIAAGAVVTKDVPDYALMAGVPAKRIGWVCECGKKLNGSLKCECGRCYSENNALLTQISNH